MDIQYISMVMRHWMLTFDVSNQLKWILPSTVQSLTCVGNWTSEDGLNSYLVGILDVPYVHKITDKFRCFIYRPSKNGGFRMAQSKDASCHKLKNPKTGYRVMHLKPGNNLRFVSDWQGDFHVLFCVRLRLGIFSMTWFFLIETLNLVVDGRY